MEGRAAVNGISAFIKLYEINPIEIPRPSHHVRTQREGTISEPTNKSPESVCTLTLNF